MRCRTSRSSSSRYRWTTGAPTSGTTTWPTTPRCCRRPSMRSASISMSGRCAVSRPRKSAGSVRWTRWTRIWARPSASSMCSVTSRPPPGSRCWRWSRTCAPPMRRTSDLKRAVDALDEDLGEAVGELYVQRYFPPASRQQVLALVENLRASYASHIEQLPWMTPETRQVALEKLAAFHPKIGYPERWRDYSGLSIVRGDAFGNLTRARVFEWQRQVRRLKEPTDRGEWGMTPQTINAYYNPTFNEVVFPAAILQPPFFDPGADPAVNYGGIGAVIGHEMGHGFDDQGSKSDARGVLHVWWQQADTEAFRKRVDRLAAQYDGFVVLPGLNVNGRLTLGENIGDLGGLSVAYDAYHRSLNGAAPPVLDGLTGDQRFFLSYAQIWRSLYREQQLRSQVLSNPHSPPKFRVNGVVRNVDAWYSAFAVQPGDKLYLPADARVRIW